MNKKELIKEVQAKTLDGKHCFITRVKYGYWVLNTFNSRIAAWSKRTFTPYKDTHCLISPGKHSKAAIERIIEVNIYE